MPTKKEAPLLTRNIGGDTVVFVTYTGPYEDAVLLGRTYPKGEAVGVDLSIAALIQKTHANDDCFEIEREQDESEQE